MHFHVHNFYNISYNLITEIPEKLGKSNKKRNGLDNGEFTNKT